MPKMFNQSQIKGIKCELECAVKFIEEGFIVSIPYGNTSRYDLIIDAGNGKYFRIQCKTAHQNENGSYTINTANQQYTANTKNIKHYDNSQIDFICSIIENQLVVIPVEMVEHSQSKIFRTVLPQYGAKSNCNLIEDFSVERYIS